MIPTPGQELPRKWAGYKPEIGRWQLGLNVTAKYEHMQLNIAQDDGASLTEAQGAVIGGMTLDVAEVGVNLWLSRHLRAQANYVMNYLSGDMRLAQSNPFYRTAEHELLLRVLAAVGTGGKSRPDALSSAGTTETALEANRLWCRVAGAADCAL